MRTPPKLGRRRAFQQLRVVAVCTFVHLLCLLLLHLFFFFFHVQTWLTTSTSTSNTSTSTFTSTFTSTSSTSSRGQTGGCCDTVATPQHTYICTHTCT
ncbi:hypothetical protein K504DRAFT_115582 [Pleomassaria siparia CBS 279.74]|uniref:Uncharacterized protein n=1 Tax=Pleomassaria siparia CBS 279.74 TaxID=1314801 RepID=A0A6G1JUY8_9PLEO|nr:hypothetical protein K504DRAFT_115582 [Pleomassaria siparia CBS 279.74]